MRAERFGEDGSVFDGSPLVAPEFLTECFLERDGLAGDDVHERSALDTGEDRLVDRRRERSLDYRKAFSVDGVGQLEAAEDQPSARTAQRLVGRRRDDVRVGKGLKWTPAATSPATWAMSTNRSAPTSWAIAAIRSKSQIRG